MVSSTTSQLFVKPLQYYYEVTEGTAFVASPTYWNIGAITSFNYKKDDNLIPVAQIGPEDVIDYAQGTTVRESSLTYGLTDSTFLKRAVNAANFGTPTGTISQPYTLLYSFYLGGTTEYFTLLKGSRPKSCSITMEVGKVTEVTIDQVHTAIAAPATSNGLTSPTFQTFATGTVWDWTSGGANPITVNAVAQNCIKFTCNIERNTSMDYTLGNTAGFGSQPHGRRITGEFVTLNTGTAEDTLFDASTEHTIAAVLKSATSTLTLSNCQLSVISREHSGDESNATVTTYSYTAESCNVT